ncbi:hypothetical protein K6W21_09125 [Burkholderia latens]|uniref:hypothetical protein n=1 Tax=Burkholderia latens TaxID=488446 RepID=UPI001C96FF22|nr:hypothetical protein [Burkholderia latens]MBY4694248.1 hypothetical protein [Burkholderia latens]
MRTTFSLSFRQMAIACALACQFVPAHAEESAKSARALLLADNTPDVYHDKRSGIVPVAVPRPRSSDKTSVTLWDEIAPPARLPVPMPVPRPGDAQHAMEHSAPIRVNQ